jgi:hypothetical protein
MARSGQVARSAPEAMTPAGSAGPAPASGFDQHMAQRLVRLGLLRHMLQSPRFYERVALGFIVIAALKGLGQENSTNTMARLTAWNSREIQRLERKIERKIERKAVH